MFRKSTAVKKEGAEVFFSLTFLFLLELLASWAPNWCSIWWLGSQGARCGCLCMCQSLITHSLVPRWHLQYTHTHTHTYTCYSHYSLISAVTYSGQANKTVHRSLIVITIYLPLITRLLFVCLNMDIKCLMIFFWVHKHLQFRFVTMVYNNHLKW